MVAAVRTQAVEGIGLHSGEVCRVRLVERAGPISLRQGDVESPIEVLRVVRADCGVQVASPDGRLAVDLVEHLLAAFAGLSIRDGILIDVDGPELPLLDAASGVWSAMLGALSPTRMPSPLRVSRRGSVEVGGSRYDFEPGNDVSITVEVDYTGRGLGLETALWNGSEDAFLTSVAPARSFGFLADHESLRQAGRAAGAAGSAIMVFDNAGRRLDAGPPTRVGELACHKLLDLLGDYYLCGGPPLGRVRAIRPGHSRNIWAARRAQELGLVVPLDGNDQLGAWPHRPGQCTLGRNGHLED